MGKLVLWLTGAAIAIAAGYYGLVAYPAERFRHEFDRALLQLPAGYSARYASVAYAPFARHATIEGLAVRGEGAHHLEFTVDHVEIANLTGDFAAEWSRAAKAATLDPATAIRVGGAITARGLSYKLGDARVAIARADIERLDVHPWALLHANAPSGTEALPFVFDRPGPPDDAELPGLIRAQAAQFLGVGFNRLVLDDVRIAASLAAGANERAQAVSYAVGHVRVERYASGRVEAAVLEGIGGEAGGLGALHIDRLAMRAVDSFRPLGRILAGEGLSRTLLDGLSFGRIEYAGIVVRLPDGTSANLRGLSLSDIAVAQGVPVSGAFAISGLGFSGKQLAARLGLDAAGLLGFDGITLDLSAAYDWDLATRRLAVRDVVLGLDQLGRVELALDLAEIVPTEPRWEGTRLVQARLRYVDSSLAERALAVAAAFSGTAPDALRRELIGSLRAMNVGLGNNQAVNLGNSPAITAAVAALVDFIRNPRSLTVELKPPASLALGALRDGLSTQSAEFFASLGLNVTTGP